MNCDVELFMNFSSWTNNASILWTFHELFMNVHECSWTVHNVMNYISPGRYASKQVNDRTWSMLRCGWVLQALGMHVVVIVTLYFCFIRFRTPDSVNDGMVNMIYSIHLSHLYIIMFLFLHLVCMHNIENAVKNYPIFVLFNYVSVFIACLFAWYWWRCEKEYNHCSLQLWRNCYNRNDGADARERNCEMLIALIVFEVFDIWMVGYMSVKKLRRVNWFRCVDLKTEKIQVISNCSIYER